MTVEAFGVAPLSRDRSTMVPRVCFNIVESGVLSDRNDRTVESGSLYPTIIIVKCYQGIVYGRIHYAGLTVRGTGPDITAIRLSVLITLLTNRHDST